MIRTILKSVREYKGVSILTPLCVSVEVILECLLPLLMSRLVDDMKEGNKDEMIIILAMLLGCAMLALLMGFLSAKFGSKAASGFASNLRHDLYYKVQDFSFENIDKFSAPSLVTRMTTDVSNIQMAYGMIIRIAVRSPLMLIFSITMSFIINYKIALIYLAMVPVVGGTFILIAKLAMPIFDKVFERYDALNESVQENIKGIRVVKTYVREDYEREKFNKASSNLVKDFVRAERIVAMNSPVLQLGMYLATIIVCVVGANIIINTNEVEMSTGQLQSIMVFGIQMLMALMIISFIFVMLSLSIAGARRIGEVLKEDASIKNCDNPVMEVKDGSIEFENVSFKYSKAATNYALEGISLKINSGEVIGIIGSTGSSKTTLVSLISRLYDVSEGTLSVGGVDVRCYDLKTLRDKVSVVLQKNVLFSGTIESNLRWGKEDATQEELEHVCDISCATEFINTFPDKYQTVISQGGTNVSGGQKQRLCIARALLKDPNILILDDSTSAVDTRTDALIRRAFRKELPNVTKIIIAQRLSSITDADRIIVLDGGKINGVGTHEELLRDNKIYQEIYEIQNRISSKEGGDE